MPLARVGARTDSTTSYSYNARRGQLPRTRIGIVRRTRQDMQYAPRVCTLVLFIMSGIAHKVGSVLLNINANDASDISSNLDRIVNSRISWGVAMSIWSVTKMAHFCCLLMQTFCSNATYSFIMYD